MRKVTITKNYNVYTFDELSEEAKEKVREWYLGFNWEDTGMAETITNGELLNIFGDSYSCLKVQYDLSCCQGSGVNIYGGITSEQVFTAAKHYGIDFSLTDKEKRRLKFYLDAACNIEDIPYNRDGCYSIVHYLHDDNKMTEYIEIQGIRDIDTNLIDKYMDLLIDVVERADKDIYDDLYNFFYEISDNDLSEACDANEWEFLEDGTMFTC